MRRIEKDDNRSDSGPGNLLTGGKIPPRMTKKDISQAVGWIYPAILCKIVQEFPW